MSTILLLRGKFGKNKHSNSADLHDLSGENSGKWINSTRLPPTFIRGDGVIGWSLENADYKNIIELDQNNFAVFLNGGLVRDVQYRIMSLKHEEHQVILRISFATVFDADNIRRVIEIKADINSDLYLCPKSFISDVLTSTKLANLTSLGFTFDNWCLSSSTL